MTEQIKSNGEELNTLPILEIKIISTVLIFAISMFFGLFPIILYDFI